MVDPRKQVAHATGEGGTLHQSVHWPGVWAALAGALAAMAYANSLDGPFVYDDFREVVDNPSIGDWKNLSSVLAHYPTRPLTNLSYAVDFAIGGLNPFNYHVTNVLLHIANVVLLFMVVLQLIRRVEPESSTDGADCFGAFAAASLFAVHPMMSGAVNYISARAEVLAATLFLASFYWFHRAQMEPGQRFFLVGTAFLLLALGAKETAVVMPAVLIALGVFVTDGIRDPGRTNPARLQGLLLWAMLVFAAARVWWYLSVEIGAAWVLQWKPWLTELHVMQLYASRMILPVSQSIIPTVPIIQSPTDPRLITAVAVVGLTITVAIAVRRRDPLIAFGVVWFWLALLPSALLFVISDRGSPMAEHRVYLASCGLFIALGAAITRMAASRPRGQLRLMHLCLTVAIAISMMATVARNRLWADPVRLWQEAVQKGPGDWMSHIQLGYTYQRIDEHVAAVAAFEQAIRLLPDDATAYLEQARSLRTIGQDDHARRVLRTAVGRLPREARTRIALASLEGTRFNNPAEAGRLCHEALLLGPNEPAAITCAARYPYRPHSESGK